MSDSSSPQKIQRFVPTQWLTEVTILETNEHIHHHYETQLAETSKAEPSQIEEITESQSIAANETAQLQAKINAKRKKQPIILVSNKNDSVGHTAFLQHQIDLRRKK